MTTSESKGRFFLQNESIRIDSHNESNRFESRIGMLYCNATSRQRISTKGRIAAALVTPAAGESILKPHIYKTR